MLIPYNGKSPQIGENVFIAPTAVLIGDVRVGDGVSIWFNAVLRADHGAIVIGEGSSIQDNSTLHCEAERATEIGRNVTVGHGSILEACRIGDGTVVGMGSTVLGGVEVGEKVMIAAGSVLRERFVAPSGTLVAGVPAVVKKELDGSALRWTQIAAPDYHQLRDSYLAQGIDRPRPGPANQSGQESEPRPG